jgi:NAD-dependent dihydropyrimidine dehydrogenase PreA subunit
VVPKRPNYSEDLLGDLRRAGYVRDFLASQARLVHRPEPLDTYQRLPRPVRRLVRPLILRRMAEDHYGQVVSLEEVREIFGLVASVVRLPCVCRRISVKRETRYCFGFSLSPRGLGAAGLTDPGYWQGPDGAGLERLPPEQALSLVEELDRAGLVHSVWTFKTPFIGGLCNCSAVECRAMLATLQHDLPVLHRGEAVAILDRSRCLRCGACARRCQFGALSYDRENRSVGLDGAHCFGCGLCVTACPAGALTLSG